jgi:hypothetical protein
VVDARCRRGPAGRGGGGLLQLPQRFGRGGEPVGCRCGVDQPCVAAYRVKVCPLRAWQAKIVEVRLFGLKVVSKFDETV